jgi:hypothetical protein
MSRASSIIANLVAEMLAMRAGERREAMDARPIPTGPCGARTRAGTPCKRNDVYWNGRCKLHGGLSTGPRTAAGKAKVAQNARKRRPVEGVPS